MELSNKWFNSNNKEHLNKLAEFIKTNADQPVNYYIENDGYSMYYTIKLYKEGVDFSSLFDTAKELNRKQINIWDNVTIIADL